MQNLPSYTSTACSVAARATVAANTATAAPKVAAAAGSTAEDDPPQAVAAAAVEDAATAGGNGAIKSNSTAPESAAGSSAMDAAAAAKRRKLPNPLVWIDLEMTGRSGPTGALPGGAFLHAVGGALLSWYHGPPLSCCSNRPCSERAASPCCRALFAAGLDIDKDTIIEIACLVTDGELKTVVEVRAPPPPRKAPRAAATPARRPI
jgi:hypothetical protein